MSVRLSASSEDRAGAESRAHAEARENKREAKRA